MAGLDYATNLDTLYLWGNKISDLSPLGYLTKLENLNLSGNSITDLRPLSSLTNLKWLDLQRNRISDISPLAGLTGLKHLDLYTNRISNISPLTGLDPLAALTNLEWLAIGANELNGDIGPVASLTGLKFLKINAFGLKDSELKTLAHALTDLERLNLSSNPITNLYPLTCLPNLRYLFLRKTIPNRIDTTNVHVVYLQNKEPPVTVTWNTN